MLSYTMYGYIAYTIYDLSAKAMTAYDLVYKVQDIYYWMTPVKKLYVDDATIVDDEYIMIKY